jgi:peptidoglycan/xylan/chitin deacetylase (PgdA/CDA1 family)
MLTKLAKKITSRFYRSMGTFWCKQQKDPTERLSKKTITLFFDFEGKYAGGEKHEPCIDTTYFILNVLRKFNIHATFNTVGLLANDLPELIDLIHDYGHEIASHTFDHSILPTLSKVGIKTNLKAVKTIFLKKGIQIVGHRSPQSQWNYKVIKSLGEEYYSWNAEDGNEDYPYLINTSNNKKIWRFPVHGDDYQYISNNLQPDKMLSFWKGLVHKKVKSKIPYIAIGFHPWIQGPESRRIIFRKFMEWLSQKDDIQILNFKQVVSLLSKGDQS